jgi:hypothetical protein
MDGNVLYYDLLVIIFKMLRAEGSKKFSAVNHELINDFTNSPELLKNEYKSVSLVSKLWYNAAKSWPLSQL